MCRVFFALALPSERQPYFFFVQGSRRRRRAFPRRRQLDWGLHPRIRPFSANPRELGGPGLSLAQFLSRPPLDPLPSFRATGRQPPCDRFPARLIQSCGFLLLKLEFPLSLSDLTLFARGWFLDFGSFYPLPLRISPQWQPLSFHDVLLPKTDFRDPMRGSPCFPLIWDNLW